MDTHSHPFNDSQRIMREQFHMLMDSLASLQALSSNEAVRESEQDLYELALDLLVRHHGIERCSIYLPQDGVLVCVAMRDAAMPSSAQHSLEKAYQFEPGEGLAGHCLSLKQQLVCNDCSQDSRYLDIPGHRDNGALIASPFLSGEELLGVLNVSDPQTNSFHPWHSSILTLFTSVLGLLVGNQRLVSDMERQIRQRTTELQNALAEAETHRNRYQVLSVIDDLTGLYNRRYFFPEASAQLSRAIRQGESCSVLLIDVDHFKQINDHCGHATGDQVLCDLAAALKSLIRDGDILARHGGEEFSLVLPATELDGAMQMAERFREHVRTLSWECTSGPVSITLSIGVTASQPAASAGDPSRQLDRLLLLADQALYAAKTNGRDQVCSR